MAVPASEPTVAKRPSGKAYQPRPKVIDPDTERRVYKTTTRRRLPIHTSRDTLPKAGTVREDGYVYRAGMAKVRKDGTKVFREYWMSPAAVEKQRAKYRALHPLPPSNRKYPVHDGTKPRPTEWKRGDIGPTGRLFSNYHLFTHRSGKIVWHECWISPTSIAGNELLNRTRVHKPSTP
jgi:hypothetical protein